MNSCSFRVGLCCLVWWLFGSCLGLAAPSDERQSTNSLTSLLERPIIDPDLALAEVQNFTETRVPLMPQVQSGEEWTKLSERMRRDALEQVVLRGKAQQWSGGKGRVVWLDTLEGGPEYRIHKLRYEALP